MKTIESILREEMNLLKEVTHETGKRPLNTRALDGLIRNLFCAE